MDSIDSAHQVAILDAHAIVAAGVSALVAAESGFEVQGVFQSVSDLKSKFEVDIPDVLIMDLQLGDASVTSEIR